jgi:hypothetical protein
LEPLLEFQLQSPTLAFLLGGILIAALGSRLTIPDSIYKFIVFMLLMKVGLKGGMAIGEADLAAMLLPALIAVFVGCLIVVIGRYTLAMLPGIRTEDGIATAGLFGAVSGSTLAAGMVVLENRRHRLRALGRGALPVHGHPGAGARHRAREPLPEAQGRLRRKGADLAIVKESLQGSALSALLLGIALGLFTNPDKVVDTFYEPLFRGSAVGVDADHGHRGLRPPERTPTRGALVRRLRRRDADRAWPDRVRARLHRPCAGRLQPGRRRAAGHHRGFEFRHLRAADPACRHPDGQPVGLHRLIDEYRHPGRDRDRHPALHRGRDRAR